MVVVFKKYLYLHIKIEKLDILTYFQFIFFLSADITMPSGKRDQPSVEDNHDGTVSLKYDPKEEGLHELFVKYNGENVQGKYVNLCEMYYFRSTKV